MWVHHDELEVGETYRINPDSAKWTYLGDTWDGRVYVEYSSGNHELKPRLWYWKDDEETNQKEEKMADKLYEITQGTYKTYGTYLATNSKSEWVMEEKGTGRVLTVPKESVCEVLPHTIGVQFGTNGTIYHYLAEAGKYDKGFYIIGPTPKNAGFVIVEVVAVNTQSKLATVEFTPAGKIAVDKLSD